MQRQSSQELDAKRKSRDEAASLPRPCGAPPSARSSPPHPSARVPRPARKAPGPGRRPPSETPLPCRAAGGRRTRGERRNPARPGAEGSLATCVPVRRWRLSLQDSHQEIQFPKGTTVAAAEPRLVLDNVADVFQLLVAQLAFMEPAKTRQQAQRESSAAERAALVPAVPKAQLKQESLGEAERRARLCRNTTDSAHVLMTQGNGIHTSSFAPLSPSGSTVQGGRRC